MNKLTTSPNQPKVKLLIETLDDAAKIKLIEEKEKKDKKKKEETTK